MKRLIFYFGFLIIVIFAMPIVFTNKFKTEEVNSEIVENEKYNYGEYNEIKLLHVLDGSIEKLGLDEYLYGVVASEMPVTFDIEALKAQAIVARTYTIYQMKNDKKHEKADICDNSFCCQAWISKENRLARWDENFKEEYWNKILNSVESTKGKIILYNQEPIKAFFHSNSGGKTEIALNVWGGEMPYLQTVETTGEDAYTSYNSEVIFTKQDFLNKLLGNYPDFNINFNEENSIKILEYNESGRVKTIKIGNKQMSGVDARMLLGLKSAKFNFEINENEIKFYVTGYGHGVGLSQCGSDVLAKNGKNYEEIIKFYYKDVEISE